jgi:hypothetical protein
METWLIAIIVAVGIIAAVVAWNLRRRKPRSGKDTIYPLY